MTVSSDPTSALRQVRTRVIAAIEDVGGVQATAAHFSTLWVPNMSSGSCGEGVFVDESAEAVATFDANGRWTQNAEPGRMEPGLRTPQGRGSSSSHPTGWASRAC